MLPVMGVIRDNGAKDKPTEGKISKNTQQRDGNVDTSEQVNHFIEIKDFSIGVYFCCSI